VTPAPGPAPDPEDVTPELRAIELGDGPGVRQHASQDQLAAAKSRFDLAYDYALAAGVHLWTATLMHQVSPDALADLDAGPLNLDLESLLLGPMLGCYICEIDYTPRARLRRCPGEPKR
jgi:hypothetical protein